MLEPEVRAAVSLVIKAIKSEVNQESIVPLNSALASMLAVNQVSAKLFSGSKSENFLFCFRRDEIIQIWSLEDQD